MSMAAWHISVRFKLASSATLAIARWASAEVARAEAHGLDHASHQRVEHQWRGDGQRPVQSGPERHAPDGAPPACCGDIAECRLDSSDWDTWVSTWRVTWRKPGTTSPRLTCARRPSLNSRRRPTRGVPAASPKLPAPPRSSSPRCPGPPEVEAVASGPDGLLESMPSGAIYVDLSSNSPTTVRRLCAAFAEKGITMLDAPVAGGVTGAEAGTLSIMVGGDQETFERIRPVLSAIGKRLFYCGGSGNGAIVKLCNNLSSQAQIAAAGEILSLGVKAGVDLEILASAIGQSTGTCRAIVDTFPKQLFVRHFEDPGF